MKPKPKRFSTVGVHETKGTCIGSSEVEAMLREEEEVTPDNTKTLGISTEYPIVTPSSGGRALFHSLEYPYVNGSGRVFIYPLI